MFSIFFKKAKSEVSRLTQMTMMSRNEILGFVQSLPVNPDFVIVQSNGHIGVIRNRELILDGSTENGEVYTVLTLPGVLGVKK